MLFACVRKRCGHVVLSLVCAFCLAVLGSIPLKAAQQETLIFVEQGRTDDYGTYFTLAAATDLSVELVAVTGLTEKGELKLGKVLEKHALQKGEQMTFRCMLTEALPALCVEVQTPKAKAQWCPSISGRDGSLLLAPSFAQMPGSR